MGREKLNRHVWLHTLAILILQDLNKEDCHEFKANLDYVVSSSPAWATPWNYISGKLEESKMAQEAKVTAAKPDSLVWAWVLRPTAKS